MSVVLAGTAGALLVGGILVVVAGWRRSEPRPPRTRRPRGPVGWARGRWLLAGDAVEYNFGRFDSPEATELLNTYANASSDEDRTAAIEAVQKIFVEEVPVIPVGTHPILAEFNTRNYVGWPSDDDPYAPGDPLQVASVQVLMHLKPAE